MRGNSFQAGGKIFGTVKGVVKLFWNNLGGGQAFFSKNMDNSYNSSKKSLEIVKMTLRIEL